MHGALLSPHNPNHLPSYASAWFWPGLSQCLPATPQKIIRSFTYDKVQPQYKSSHVHPWQKNLMQVTQERCQLKQFLKSPANTV